VSRSRLLGHGTRRAAATAAPAAAPIVPATPALLRPNRAHMTETEQRVNHIADLMVEGRWVVRVTCSYLAAKWGVREKRVRELSAEANRLLRAELSDHDRDAIRTKLCATLDRLIAHACAPGGNPRVAVDAIRCYGEFLGLKQLVVEHHATIDQFAGWTAEELDAYASTGARPVRTIELSGRPLDLSGELSGEHDGADKPE